MPIVLFGYAGVIVLTVVVSIFTMARLSPTRGIDLRQKALDYRIGFVLTTYILWFILLNIVYGVIFLCGAFSMYLIS